MSTSETRYQTKMGEVNDPLLYGTVHINENDVPKFESGSKILNELGKLNDENRFLDTILHGPNNIIDFFQEQFPELVDTNDIGKLKKEGFNSWIPGNNDITIEVDPKPYEGMNNAKDVYIGGPAALFAAAIQANNHATGNNVLYGHDGMKGLSNWKGSASYFHIRDAIPVYYWPDNSGVYTLYCTAKHAFQRRFTPVSYKKEYTQDPNFNKLRLNIKSLLKDPLILPQVFVKNALYTVKDVNLHLTKTHLINPVKSTAYTTMEHARLTREILPKMNLEKPILIPSTESGKALHLHLGDEGLEECRNVFRNLTRIGGESVKHNRLTQKELKDRGYDTEFVQQGLEFVNDGYLVPYADQQLGQHVLKNGGEINNSMRLKKVLVAPTEGGDDCRASKIVWEDVRNGRIYTTPVKSLYLSLGPSVRNLKVVAPEYSLSNHIIDILKAKLSLADTDDKKDIAYSPTLQSLCRNFVNKMTRANLLQKTMWASGLSSTILIKVDKTKVSESTILKYRDHIDAHNKHCVRLAEKEAIIDGKPHQLFVLQLTGGGHFPIKDVHSEAAINVLKANFIPLLNLNQDGIEFEILSARSCARGICAQNVFRMKAPLANTVMIYGIGGIGMTTMAGNALLMKAVLEKRQKLSNGDITTSEFQKQVKESDFSNIPHWKWANPFSRNYAQFVDSVKDPREVARKLGLQKTRIPAQDFKENIKLVKRMYNFKNALSRFVK